MPLLLLLAGAALATHWFGDGLAGVAGAVFGLLVGIVLLRVLSQRSGCGAEPSLRTTFKRTIISNL
jgi:hypothetical protein